jgi:large subunit ribosomal protein L31e
MGCGKDFRQVPSNSEEETVANWKDKGLGWKDLTEKQDEEQSPKTEEREDGSTENIEETDLGIEEEEKPLKEEEAEPEKEEVSTPPEKEEERPSPREEKPEEAEIVEERIYTVPLGKAWIMPPRKRSARAMRMLRAFVAKHMKLEAREEEEEEEEEPAKLVISNEVNEKVWVKGVEKPPRKIRIRATKDKEGNIKVYLAEGD